MDPLNNSDSLQFKRKQCANVNLLLNLDDTDAMETHGEGGLSVGLNWIASLGSLSFQRTLKKTSYVVDKERSLAACECIYLHCSEKVTRPSTGIGGLEVFFVNLTHALIQIRQIQINHLKRNFFPKGPNLLVPLIFILHDSSILLHE